jgi:hypothetical protein
MVEVSLNGARVRGEVHYFNERALILRKEREYILINIAKYEDLKLTIVRKSEKAQMRETIEQEVVRPS